MKILPAILCGVLLCGGLFAETRIEGAWIQTNRMTINNRPGKETVTMTFSNENLRLTSVWRDDRWWDRGGEAVHVLRDYQKVGECTWMTNRFRFIYTYMLLPADMHGGERFDRSGITWFNFRMETNRLLLWPDDGATNALFKVEEPAK